MRKPCTDGSTALCTIAAPKPISILLFFLFTFASLHITAQKQAVQSGNWNDAATWDSGIPGSSDDVIIAGNYTVTVDVTNAACANLQIGSGDVNNGGQLTFLSGAGLTVSGTITLGDAAGAVGTLTLETNATLTAGTIAEGDPGVSGVYETNYGTIRFNGTFTLPDNLYQFNNLIVLENALNTGISGLQIDGDLTIYSDATLDAGSTSVYRTTPGGTLTIQDGGWLKIGGTNMMPGGFSTHVIGNSSTIEYNGSNQTISQLNSGENYGNLIISGTGTKQITANIGIDGDLNINSSIFNLNGYTANRSTAGGNFIISNGATLRITGSGTLPSNFATHNFGTSSTVDYRGTSTQQIGALSSGKKYGNLTIQNSNKSLMGNTTVAGTLTFAGTSCRLSLGNYQLTIEGSVSGLNSSTRNFTGSSGSALTLNGTGNRTLFFDATTPGTTNRLNKLTLNHSGFSTILGNDLVINDTCRFTAGKLQLNGKTLTLNGVIVNTVTEGLTGSTTSNLIIAGAAGLSFDQTTDGTTNTLAALTIQNTGHTATLLNTLKLAGDLNILTGTLDISNQSLNRISAGGTLTIGSGAALAIGGTGTLPANFSTHSIDTYSTITLNGGNQTVPALNSSQYYGNLNITGTGVKSLNGDVSIVGTLTFNGSILSIGNHTLTIDGDVVNTTSEGLRGGSTSNLIFDGVNNSPTVSFDQSSPGTTNILNDLTIDCSSRSLTLGNTLRVIGTVMPTSGTLVSDGNLHLASSATATARVGRGANAGGYIHGDVTVERYISAGRKWQYLSVPVTGTQTIHEAWQEGQTPGSSISNGMGTWITSPDPSAVANGFDYQSNTVSIKTYDPSSNTWTPLTSTYNAISDESAYMIFVRGDRGCTSLNSTTTSTVLRMTGTLKQGDQASVSVGANTSVPIGNPYPSALDFRDLHRSASIDDLFYVWDPKLTGALGLGGYQTFTWNGSNYTVTPGGGSYGSSGSVNNTIESGQSFFVHATGSSGTVTIDESGKASGSRLVARDAGTTSVANGIRINLYSGSFSTTNLADGVFVEMDPQFSNAIERTDARKMINTGENLAVYSSGVLLSVERRTLPGFADTIHLQAGGLKIRDYVFEINTTGISQPGLIAELVDQFTGINTALPFDQTTYITVSVTSNPLSKNVNRWQIVFRPSGVLPMRFIEVNAQRQSAAVVVNWTVAQAASVKKYEVERSANGQEFVPVQTVRIQQAANSTSSYQITDLHPLECIAYYRIRSTDESAKEAMSPVVKVMPLVVNQSLIVSPNPVENKQMQLHFNKMPRGQYQLQLTDPIGSVQFRYSINHSAAGAVQTVSLPAQLTAGIYQLNLTDSEGKTYHEQVFIR